MPHPIDSSLDHDRLFPVAAGDDDEKGGAGKNWAFEQLKKSRTIELFGPVNNALAKRVISSLLFLEADDPSKPILMVQNSPGGSVTDGFAIYDTMRFVKPDVKVLCVGLTASIATITLLGAKKEHRYSLPNTEYLIHQPLIAGNVFGRASDLEITANEILKTRGRINEMLAEATGQPLEVVEKHTQRDYWMNAQEALEYGLVAKVVTNRAEIE
ncbi:MAG: ATP-dependent Clp protease proteolytic subunit [Deltaproteobacteria bacterium]|nr:ATP-dependent Clp protease proteolytic subunit [Deltaproteobacteria bacterium]